VRAGSASGCPTAQIQALKLSGLLSVQSALELAFTLLASQKSDKHRGRKLVADTQVHSDYTKRPLIFTGNPDDRMGYRIR
jgi:hypothetical protein